MRTSATLLLTAAIALRSLIVAATDAAAQRRITLVAFLDPAINQERYFAAAYQLALIEYLGNLSFSDLDGVEAEAAIGMYRTADGAFTWSRPSAAEQRDFTFRLIPTVSRAAALDPARIEREAFDAVLDQERSRGSQLVMLGGYSSERERRKAEWCQENNVPLITGGAATSSIFSDNPVAFGLLSPIQKLAESTMRFLDVKLAALSRVNVVLLVEDVAHGADYRQGIVQYIGNATSKKFDIVYEGTFPYNVPDARIRARNFRDIVAQVKEQVGLGDGSCSPKGSCGYVLLVDAHSADFRSLHRELVREDLSFLAISYGARGTDIADLDKILGTASNAIEAAALEQSLNGVFAGLWWSPGSSSEASQRFVTSWRKYEAIRWLHGLDLRMDQGEEFIFVSPGDQLEPSWFGALGYEAMHVALVALEQATSLDAQGIVSALAATDVSSFLPGGRIKFDSTGQVYGPFTMAQNAQRGGGQGGLIPFIVYPDDEKSGPAFRIYQPFSSPRPPCSAEFFAYSVSECTAANIRRVEYYYLDDANATCANPTTSCYCDPTTVHSQPVNFEAPCEFIHLDSNEAVVARAVASCGTAISALLLGLLFASWSSRAFHHGQRPLLVLISLSTAWCSLSVLTLVGENTESACRLRIWNTMLSAGLAVSLLLGRVVYWYRVWQNPSTETLMVHPLRLAAPIGMSFSACLAVTMAWMLVQPVFTKVETQIVGTEAFDVRKCDVVDSVPVVVPILAAVYFSATLLHCVLLAYQSKDCDGRYFESWYNFVATFNVVFVCLVLAVVIGLLEINSVGKTLFIGMSLWWSAIGCAIFSFLPRISAAFGIRIFGSKPNEMGSSTNAASTNSENVLQKYVHGRARRQTSKSTNNTES